MIDADRNNSGSINFDEFCRVSILNSINKCFWNLFDRFSSSSVSVFDRSKIWFSFFSVILSTHLLSLIVLLSNLYQCSLKSHFSFYSIDRINTNIFIILFFVSISNRWCRFHWKYLCYLINWLTYFGEGRPISLDSYHQWWIKSKFSSKKEINMSMTCQFNITLWDT